MHRNSRQSSGYYVFNHSRVPKLFENAHEVQRFFQRGSTMTLGAASSGSIASAHRVEPFDQSFRMMLRSWRTELAPFPKRWRRAAHVAFVTALGAGVTAILQISNPLGLTMLLSFAAPEYAFSLATAIKFLVGAAAMQLLMLAVIGALVDAPVLHVCVFIAYTFISTYLIYGVPSLGRLWVWVQIPTVTAFYMVMFDQHGLGWDNAEMFAGLVLAVTLLWLFNNVIWPEPAAGVLSGSLRSTLERSRRRLGLLMRIFLAKRESERGPLNSDRPKDGLALLNVSARVRVPAQQKIFFPRSSRITDARITR